MSTKLSDRFALEFVDGKLVRWSISSSKVEDEFDPAGGFKNIIFHNDYQTTIYDADLKKVASLNNSSFILINKNGSLNCITVALNDMEKFNNMDLDVDSDIHQIFVYDSFNKSHKFKSYVKSKTVVDGITLGTISLN